MSKSVYSMGEHTLSVPMSLHRTNRERLCNQLREKGVETKSIVLLQGGEDCQRYCTDVNHAPFRQESFFHWTFGVLEPGFFGAIDVYTKASLLFMPKLPESYVTWMGELRPPSYYRDLHAVDEVYYVDDMADVLHRMNPAILLLLRGKNTDSGSITKPATFEGIDSFKTNTDILYPVITELRVIKTEEELKVLRYANKISSEAHRKMMMNMRPNTYEYKYESMFLDHVYANGGMRHVCYTCICASGEKGAILHYGHAGEPNSRLIQDGDMCLFDLGGEYYCYCSDITCSFPANGVFSDDQKIIYNAVLKASKAVLDTVRPGVNWVDMHKLAERTMLGCLVEAGLLKGSVDEMMKVRLGAVFQACGLGHLMGLDVHDVGGYIMGPERSTEAGLKSLRTARDLKRGMVLTVEPGCYFTASNLDKAFSNPNQACFLVKEEIERFKGFGGVRIEDNIIITDNGCEIMTDVPRTIEDIEKLMAEGKKLQKES